MSSNTLLSQLSTAASLKSPHVIIEGDGELKISPRNNKIIAETHEKNKQTARHIVNVLKKEWGKEAGKAAEAILWDAQYKGKPVNSRHIQMCLKIGDQVRLNEKNDTSIPYGLKGLQNRWQDFKIQANGFYKALKDRTLSLGPYRLGKIKDKGVEPGFVGYKIIKPSDHEKIKSLDHRFSKWAADFFIKETKRNDSPTTKALLVYSKDNHFKDPAAIIDQFSNNLKNYLNENELLNASSKKIFEYLMQDETIAQLVEDWIMIKDNTFSTPHYIKLDYQEDDTRKSLTKRNVKVQIPKANAKNTLHRYFTAKTREAANFSAVRECLANDMMRAMGIYTQDLKIIASEYTDGSPKLLLDGKHMKGESGEFFKDFSGAIKDGYLIDAKGNSDQSIIDLGKYLIFFLLLGDRDAIGSRGDNKGRIGNQFAAIDPGHSFELNTGLASTNLMTFNNVHSDFSFDQPDLPGDKLTKGYKNFTIFQDRPYIEKFKGILELRALKDSGKDIAVIDAYIQQFFGGDLNFHKPLIAIKKAYIERRDYILNVFKERLAAYDADTSKGLAVLSFLDHLEKKTSQTSDYSENKIVKLKYPRVTKRTPWNIKYNQNNNEYIFSTTKNNKETTASLQQFLKEIDPDQNNLKLNISKSDCVIQIPGHLIVPICEAINTKE